jgi:hypothetical protein
MTFKIRKPSKERLDLGPGISKRVVEGFSAMAA